MGRTLVSILGFMLFSHPAYPASQVPFEDAVRGLGSADAGTRLRAVRVLKEAAYPEAAVPLARLLTDRDDTIQLEAIAAELNIFLAERVSSRRRVGLVIERRTSMGAEQAFTQGPRVLGVVAVPGEVLSALRSAAQDENPRVALEALYAFGALAGEPAGAARKELLRASGPALAAFTGAPDLSKRVAAMRVLAYAFARRSGDDPIDLPVGDALVSALNDRDEAIRSVAMYALGALRYERGVHALTDLVQYHNRGPVAEAALDALAHLAHPASTALMVSQLVSRSGAMRGIAIEGLARIGDPATLVTVQSAMTGERAEPLRLAGAFAAAMLGGQPIDRIVAALGNTRLREQARQYLTDLAPVRAALFAPALKSPDGPVRLELVEALGLSRERAATPLVEPLTKDPDPQIAAAAQRALARLR